LLHARAYCKDKHVLHLFLFLLILSSGIRTVILLPLHVGKQRHVKTLGSITALEVQAGF
jgi:hypothetical protein